MKGVHLIGHGGVEKLVFKSDIPKPEPKDDEVLIKVSAAGVNNTDINTRIVGIQNRLTTNTNDRWRKRF